MAWCIGRRCAAQPGAGREHLFQRRAHATTATTAAQASLEIFADALQKIRSEYVDGTNLTYHHLVYSALKGMVNPLDPHSEFLDAGFLPGIAG